MLNSSLPIIPNLLDLDISYNQFKQIGDVGIWEQCHLKQLHASHNYFEVEKGNTPKKVSKCSQYALEWLDLSGCSNVTIPEPLGRLANLRGIDISHSRLTGPMPESLGKLRSLEVLDLSHNYLTGPIPTFLGNLSELDLSFNQLNGSIPESFGNLAVKIRLLFSIAAAFVAFHLLGL
ncbi:hypothetical protein L1887_15010 [Cichorium endivia]|nr:hypothetical protein L1887_15010 [Cichorium endivia]